MANTATGGGPAFKAPGRDIVVTTTVEIIGVLVMAMLAGINNEMGNIVVLLMVGFAIAWALSNTTQLRKVLGQA